MRALSSDERVARHQAVRHVYDRSGSLALRRCSTGCPVSMGFALLLRIAYRCWRGLLPLAAAVVMFSGVAQAANDPAVVQSAFRFSRAVQQHLSTGFPLRGAHEIARCESCHVRGVFKGTPKDCATCHGPGARISSVTMTAGHPVVTQPCTVCHNQISFSGIKFDHTNAMPGTCASCHNGMQASGKPSGHAVTTQSCDTCHRSTTLWAGASFDHTSVRAGTCLTCHNGSTATGKPGNHLVTSASCDSCHQVTGWKKASFSHAGVAAGTCASCHNGTSASGMPPTHVPVKGSCDACHKTSTFAGTAMNHAGFVSACAACHDTGKNFFGVSIKTPPPNHVPAPGIACEACHASANFTAFSGTPMNHQPVSGTACATCHETGRSYFGVTIVTRPTPAQDRIHPSTGDCGTCHTTSSFAVASVLPANHLPTAQACALCHTSLPSYKPGIMNHTGIGSGCTTCHAASTGGIAFVGVTPVPQGSGHIPTAADCATCHSSTVRFGPGTAMNHAAISAGCATCHESGKSFVGVKIVTRPTPAQDPNHPATGDCGTCHTTTSFAGAAGKPPNHIPTSQACTLCHANPLNYKPGVMNHAGIVNGCATCHAVGSTGTAFYGVSPTPQGSGHIPTSADCVTCHASTAKFGPGTVMQHTGITNGCATCHDTGKSFTGVTNLKTKPSNHVPTAAACEVCHAASKFTSFAGTAMQHTGISSGCTTCHAASATGTPFFGVTPLAQGSGHIPTNADCVSCHASTAKFGPGTPMNHAPVAGTPCATCHETGKSFTGVAIVTRPTAAQDAAHPSTGDCGTCHSSTTSFATGVTGKPANHIPTTQACTLCHTSLPASYKPGVMNHAGISSGCTTCHAVGASGTAFYGVTPLAQGSGHIPTGRSTCVTLPRVHQVRQIWSEHRRCSTPAVSGTACATCHATGNAITGDSFADDATGPHPDQRRSVPNLSRASNFTTLRRQLGTHEARGGGGDAVREVSRGRAEFRGYAVVTRPTAAQDAAHPPTGDCGTCHSSTTSFSDRSDRQARESHSDDAGVHAVPHEPAGLVQAGGDEPRAASAAAVRRAMRPAAPARRSSA